MGMQSLVRSLVAAASIAAVGAAPAVAAQYERSGAWVFQSQAFAADDDGLVYACMATTESADGTALSLRLEPAAGGGVTASMALTNSAWALGDEALRVRFDIGADHWFLPGQGAGDTVETALGRDAAVLEFLEDLASSSFAGVTGRGGARVAQFSLKGSRGAIEAAKACVEAQIGRELAVVFAAGATTAANPF